MITQSRTDWSELPFKAAELMDYLASFYGGAIELHTVRKLKEATDDKLKEFGYGNPLFIEFSHIDQTGQNRHEQVVLHTMAPERFGHERRADRAYNLLLEYDTFNKLPRHAPSVDVGALTKSGGFISLGEAGEFFHLSQFVPGTLYAHDLPAIAKRNALLTVDRTRIEILADYLATIHAKAAPNPNLTDQLYCRAWRDLVGHGEGIMGMLDNYPADCAVAPPTRLAAIERQCVAWRWRYKTCSHRLRQVHGDFHPWNILFQENNEIALLDRSRGEWGEPADDVSALTINYLLFSLREEGTFAGPFAELFTHFWERYLTQSNDHELLEVVPPFFAWRALVVAHPVWYPSLAEEVRAALFHFIEAILRVERFDPAQVHHYLEQG